MRPVLGEGEFIIAERLRAKLSAARRVGEQCEPVDLLSAAPWNSPDLPGPEVEDPNLGACPELLDAVVEEV